MKQKSPLRDMTRLGWDQSFLEDFARPEDPICVQTPFQNFEERVSYANLCNEDWVDTSQDLPNREDSPRSDVNSELPNTKFYQNLLYINSLITSCTERNHSDNRDDSDMGFLRFLLEQVERKKGSELINNSYSCSSQILPLTCITTTTSTTTSLAESFVSCCPPTKENVDRVDEFNDNFSNKSQEEFLFSKYQNQTGSVVKSSEFFVFQLTERYGLAKLLKSYLPTDFVFESERRFESQRIPEGIKTESQNPDLPFYSVNELQILKSNLLSLLQCGFYLGRLTADESRRLLSGKSLGTFFLRDSSNPGHLLSLSVQTRRGATSIRIFFRSQVFGLETDAGAEFTPTFDSVLGLVQYYVENPNKSLLVESSGRCDTPVILTRPLLLTVPRLTHATRVTVNSHLAGQNVDRLCLKPSLKDYLKQYPFSI